MVTGYWREEEEKKTLFATVPHIFHQLTAIYHADIDHFHPDMISSKVHVSEEYAKLEASKKRGRGTSYGIQCISNVPNITYEWKFKVCNVGEVGFGISTNVDPAKFKQNNPFNAKEQKDRNNYVIKIENHMG